MKQSRGYCEDTGEFRAFVVASGLCQLFCTDIPASSLSRGVFIFYSQQDNTGCFFFFYYYFFFPQEGNKYVANKISRELKCLHAFIKFFKLATALRTGSFLGVLAELQCHPDKLIVCIPFAETERKRETGDEYSEQ